MHVDGIVMLPRLVQPLKQEYGISFIPSGKTIEVKPLQAKNASSSMLVTPLPIVTDVKPPQPENARYPMLVTPFPIVTDVKPLQ